MYIIVYNYVHAVALAKQSEKAGRYTDCSRLIRELIRTHIVSHGTLPQSNQHQHQLQAYSNDLTDEERQLLSQSYKQCIGDLRAAWRSIRNMIELNINNNATDDTSVSHGFIAGNISYNIHSLSSQQSFTVQLVDDYKKSIELELQQLCQDIIQLIEASLLQTVTKTESKIFYLKLVGDYYRYLAEIQPAEYGDKSAQYYQQAYQMACNELESTNCTRLAVALNYSVLLYEVIRDKQQACDISKHAFDVAIAKLDESEENSYRESTLLMQLLRDNTYVQNYTCRICTYDCMLTMC